MRRLLAVSAAAALALAAGCSNESEPVDAATARRVERPRAEQPLKRSRCHAGLTGCRVAAGRIIYVERVDPDGDGDAHFVLASRDSITGPGISVIDVRRDLRPKPLPVPGDRISAAGRVQVGSYGQRQIEAVKVYVRR